MSNQNDANGRQSLASLQMLRGVAAMMVVVHHIGYQIERSGGHWSDHWLNAGVDLFFIISGFLMWSTTAGRNIGPLDFLRRRIVRIVPLYWVITSGVVSVSLLAPHLMQSAAPDPLRILASYLFIFMPRGNGFYVPVLGQGWTLNYEMFFYLVFAISLLFVERRRFIVSAGLIFSMISLGLPRWNLLGGVSVYTNPIMLEFVAGMLVAMWFGSRRHSTLAPIYGKLVFLSGSIALIILATFFPEAERVLVLGIPSLLIFTGAILVEKSGSLHEMAWLRRTGDISYSVYLSHASVLSAAAQAWRTLQAHGLSVEPLVFCLLAFVASMATGAAVYRWVELPMTRFFRAGTAAPGVTAA